MAVTRVFHYFLELPDESKIKVIQHINDDKTLFRLFTTSKYMRSLLHANVNTIFKPRVNRLTDLTNQPVTALVLQNAEAYLRNTGRLRPYVVDQTENHTRLSYMVFKGFEKAAVNYLAGTNNREEIRHKARHGYNILSLAILSGNPAMVDFILSQPEALHLVNEQNDYTDKPIHIASRMGNRQILRSMISHPAIEEDSINLTGNYAYTPLMNFCVYCKNDDPGFLQDLIEYGARIDDVASTTPGSSDPLYVAIHKGKHRVAKMLLEFIKHDVNRYVRSPKIAMKEAVARGYKDIVKVFVFECHVKADISISPDNSLLLLALPSCDLELIQIIFQLEAYLYKSVARDRCSNAGVFFNMPVFADYLLGALKSLTKSPASKDKVEVYQLLLELGFTSNMIWHNSGDNVFHFIAPNLLSFIGETEESITFSEKIIYDLIEQDLRENFRNKANNKGITPLQLLPIFTYQVPTTSFDEQVKIIIAEARKKYAGSSQAAKPDKYVLRRLPIHDEVDRGRNIIRNSL